jgi:transglutaminase-like putative cysteine protease
MDQTTFRVGCDLDYEVSGPSSFIFNVAVVSNPFQRIIDEEFLTSPVCQVEESLSSNAEKRHHRFSSTAGPLRVSYRATVGLGRHIEKGDDIPETVPAAVPSEVIPYLYPSRYCESDKLVRLAQHEFGKLQHGFSRVTAICNWIRDNVEYLRGSTNPLTSAFDTATERAGVCRDFAHLAIAFCRAILIPARFVAGYAHGLQPADFHAYFEAYLGRAWYIFDPTRLAPQTGFIRIGTGRDAADTSFATIFGPAIFSSMRVIMELQQGQAPFYTTDAISTSSRYNDQSK